MADQGVTVGDNVPSCVICMESTRLKMCARCRCVFYCSKEHQKQDWASHKSRCKKSEAVEIASNLNLIHPIKTEIGGSADDDTIEFDSRSYKPSDFSKPPSYTMSDLSNFAANKLTKHGYCVIDGILSETQCSNVMNEVEKMKQTGLLVSSKSTGDKMNEVNGEKLVNSKIRSDQITWLQTEEQESTKWPAICELVKQVMDKVVYGMTDHFEEQFLLAGRTKMMISCYPGQGTSYRRHVDNSTKDGRVITCTMYLNKDWDVQESGGVLRIFPSSPEGDYMDISPDLNRLLLFWSNSRNPHEVQPTHATRFSITCWYYDDIERTEAKQLQADEELKQINSAMLDADVKKKQMEKDLIAQRLENEATRAINSLSQGEIQAMSMLLESNPQGRDMLSAMGVSDAILDVLVKRIKKL